jgi:polyketide synthase PksN
MKKLVRHILSEVVSQRLSHSEANELLAELQEPDTVFLPEPSSDGSDDDGARSAELLLLRRQWQEVQRDEGGRPSSERYVILAGWDETQALAIQAAVTDASCDRLASEANTASERYTEYAAGLLRRVQGLFRDPPTEPTVVQLVVPVDDADGSQLVEGLSGLLVTLAAEVDNVAVQTVALETSLDADVIAEHIRREARNSSVRLRYAHGRRWEIALELVTASVRSGYPWRDGGVYLITGGTGGLGLIFAYAIANAVANPLLILTGRSPLDAAKERAVEELQSLGAVVEYRSVDIGDASAMELLVDELAAHYGVLNGAIHAAGVLRDSLLATKTEEELRTVFAPKVTGAEALDWATRRHPLDVFVLFSSTASVFGNVGQADYAAANGFLDAYADYRRQLVEQGERSGRTLSVNWPLWAEGGMQVDEVQRDRMWRDYGLAPLERDDGVQALERGLSEDTQGLVVLYGDTERLSTRLLDDAGNEPVPATAPGRGWRPEFKGLEVSECLLWDLKQLASEQIKVDRDRLDIQENLTDFGFDSVTLASLANELASHFGIELSPALFFSYPTLAQLRDYILAAHGELLAAFYSTPEASDQGARSQTIAKRAKRPRQRRRQTRAAGGSGQREPIAVVGMSGRFPEARTTDAFWETLRQGMEAVGEVPAERFDVTAYYGDPEREPGTTNCKWLASLPGVAEFDPLFFSISPREAELMDPRQRLLLQHAWAALEDGGYDADALKQASVGTFVGVEQGDYVSLLGDEADVTGNHDGVLAARLAYALDLNGPTFSLNTACSSGLVALHQACQSLRDGECEAAVAGGAHLILTPRALVAMGQAGMLSPEGRCYTFDERANGMVPGEAVVSLVLKRLSQAEADGDPIRGVIRASGVNYDGRTNGITAPSGAAQARLLRDVYRRNGVQPSEIEHLVAHGTGTRLGDPIEVNALNEVFKEDEGATPGQTALTSTKTNVGHTQAASGLVSLVALLEGMRHEAIPASLHCERESEYIDWSASPFYVNKELTAWPARETPRVGAVSAFGISGTNAHAVVASYEQPSPEAEQTAFHLLVVSARTAEALERRVADLVSTLEGGAWPSNWLAAMSRTLLEGRQHFRERAAFVVADQEDAIRVLRQYGSRERVPNVFAGTVARDFEPQKALQRYGEQLCESTPDADAATQREQLSALADLYCQGYELDWSRLFGERLPRRISLPTYPFEDERYWAQAGSEAATRPADRNDVHYAGAGEWLVNALLQRNTSTLRSQCFTSRLTGSERFLADHDVRGQTVLPGSAYLEMARAAVAVSLEREGPSGSGIRLSHVVFAQPLVVASEPLSVHVAVEPLDDRGVGFVIYTGAGETSVIHAEGRAYTDDNPEPASLNVAALRAQCSLAFDAEPCYEAFAGMGLSYGPTHRVIHDLSVGDGMVVASLSGTDTVLGEGYVLDPAILDGALQAPMGFALAAGDQDHSAALPFAVESVSVYGPLPDQGWAVVQDSGTSGSVQKFDVDITDDQGSVRARLEGFSLRTGQAGQSAPEPRSAPETEPSVRLFRPHWIPQEAGETATPEARLVVLVGLPRETVQQVQDALSGARCILLEAPKAVGGGARYVEWAAQLQALLQALLAEQRTGSVTVQLCCPNSGDACLAEGLVGMLASLAAEQPTIAYQSVGIDPNSSGERIAAQLSAEAGSDRTVRYRDGQREVRALEAVTAPSPSAAWRDRGVYLITGGVGGLGWLVADAIGRSVERPVLMLTGRSTLDSTRRARIKALESLGAVVDYRAVDVSDVTALAELVSEVRERHGALTGVVHAAGVLADDFVFRKSERGLRDVLRPKVLGAEALDTATAREPLDCFVLFASTAGVFGNVAQSDYAAANGYLDAFARLRSDRVAAGERSGRTVSVDWPLWADGGMAVDEATRERMWRDVGLVPLERDAGLAALASALTRDDAQVVVLAGDPERIDQLLLARDADQPVTSSSRSGDEHATTASASTSITEGRLHEAASDYLKRLLASDLKIPAERIDATAPLEEYGIDSVVVTRLTNTLEQTFGSLPRTLFFEYQTLDALTGYFLDEHRDQLIQVTGMVPAAGATTTPGRTAGVSEASSRPAVSNSVTDETSGQQTPGWRRQFQAGLSNHSRSQPSQKEPIALVGVSGRYPQAWDVEAFWSNLVAGVDSIAEVPGWRWDHERYFDPVKGKAGTTYTKWGGFIDGVDEFDPVFFGIAPREAEFMDPQERLFLQEVYHALEDAGITRQGLTKQASGRDLPGQVGVFAGVMYEEYQLYGAQAQMIGENVALSGNPASVANRVSYFCDFHGPSLTVDTMCSSSLTAIHLACQSLRSGECRAAIAGGVNVSIHPNKYLALGQGQFAASNGRCMSFGEGGDGYVPGEGVGAVLLKPLSAAEADGDRIYGVIRGSAVNHGGKTNGYTVPNPNAQASVVRQALRDAEVDPRAISYVEAHGTGTSLGDPIEIAGLSNAFGDWTEARQYCAIGSAKSNIGHAESAAGIAGLTKVLLQMRHGELAPSLHSEPANPNIDFERTPFVVQRERGVWQRPEVDGEEKPRIAGLSSFGAGGSNAHLIIEEYAQPAGSSVAVSAAEPAVVVLSARNAERLAAQAQQLRDHLVTERPDLAAVAYTLQVGREAMDVRLACVASDLDTLIERLEHYLDGDMGAEGLYSGEVRSHPEVLELLGGEDLEPLVAGWVTHRRYAKLAEAWAKGVPVDWSRLWGEQTPCRIALPGYPFARERYWPDDLLATMGSAAGRGGVEHHVLAQRNTSNVVETRFTSTLTGSEFFLADHQVSGAPMLPGAAYLEMARASVLAALERDPLDAGGIRLRQVVFAEPLMLGAESVAVHVAVEPQDDGSLGFEVYTGLTDDAVVHAEGRVDVDDATAELPAVDVASLRAQCSETIAGERCYEAFQRMGLEYGSSHRVLEDVCVGDGLVVASLARDASVPSGDYVLDPAVLDGAFQAAVGFSLAGGGDGEVALPFAVETVAVHGAMPDHGWAVVRDVGAAGPVHKLDIDVVDQADTVRARLTGFTARAPRNGAAPEHDDQIAQTEALA